MTIAEKQEQETDELRNFRENWKKEVWEKQRLQQAPSQASVANPSTTASLNQPDAKAHTHTLGRLQSRNNALEVYSRAVKHEQASELDDALRLYRQAFRLDSNVDKAYHLREQKAAPRAPETSASVTATSVQPNAENKVAGSVGPAVDGGVVRVKRRSSSAHHPERQVSGLLAQIVVDFPVPLCFEPEDEREPLHLQRLPDELLVHILSYLGVTTIELFACVSRKARIITLDVIIWRSVDLFSSHVCAESTRSRGLCASVVIGSAVLIVSSLTGHL
jgi:F-box protein 9